MSRPETIFPPQAARPPRYDRQTLEAVAEFIRKHRVDIAGSIVRRKRGEVIPTYDYKLIEAIQGGHIEGRP